MKKVYVAVLAVIILAGLSITAEAVDNTEKANMAPQGPAGMRNIAGARKLARPNFNMLSGSVVKIDNTDPAKPKLEIKNDADGAITSVEVTPFTNIIKAVELSELKTGDTVRAMVRKADNTNTAINIMFGKIKKLPAIPRKANEPPVKMAPKK